MFIETCVLKVLDKYDENDFGKIYSGFTKSKLHHGCSPEDDFKCFDQQYSKLIQNPVKHLRLGVF